MYMVSYCMGPSVVYDTETYLFTSDTGKRGPLAWRYEG